MKRYFLGPLALLLPAAAVSAQSFAVTGLLPTANSTAMPRTGSLQVVFSQPLAANAATTGGLRVFSNQYSGRLSGTTTVTANNLTFKPANGFQPGEKVLVSVPVTVRSSTGTPLVRPAVYELTAAAQGGSGTFAAPVTLGVGNEPFNVATGDVNNDGYLDLVTCNVSDGNVSVRLNNGRGAFDAAGTGQVVVGPLPFWVQLGDIDADGDLDILTANRGNRTITIRPNEGRGQFGAGIINLPVSTEVRHLTLTDIDGDGDLDILSVGEGANPGLSVLRNNGAFIFAAPVAVAVGSAPCFVVTADVDNDGDQDAMVANSNADGTVDLLRNDGTGTFSRTVALRLAGVLSSVAAADMDADGDLDLLITNIGKSTVVLAHNDGQGGLAVTTTLVVSGLPRAVMPADVNGDGAFDIVVSSEGANQVMVALNNGRGQLTASATLVTGRQPIGVTTGDIDYDGDLDVLVANIGSNSVSTWLNNAAVPTPSMVARPAAARLQLAPNPAQQATRVQVPIGTVQVQLLSAMGQVVRTQSVGAGQVDVPLPLAGLPAGVYLVRVGMVVGRLVVQ